jgi:hypothetical protein
MGNMDGKVVSLGLNEGSNIVAVDFAMTQTPDGEQRADCGADSYYRWSE